MIQCDKTHDKLESCKKGNWLEEYSVLDMGRLNKPLIIFNYSIQLDSITFLYETRQLSLLVAALLTLQLETADRQTTDIWVSRAGKRLINQLTSWKLV